ncbi:unnamed protein product [Fraxinus pennsylvanica]|uniref:eRF1/Pelota-like N-terminal domain-containing protein n=1 Tax=Fraxinus pennsylvanica TaxID=56036 RepID=A0AAD2E1U6_9LAMI|nr:unnamed protein product [Fraxinus pennsylvanica]
MADGQENYKNIEIWKIKKWIEALEAARGNGTSMIFLIIPLFDQISQVTKMLAEEYGTASNIKSKTKCNCWSDLLTSTETLPVHLSLSRTILKRDHSSAEDLVALGEFFATKLSKDDKMFKCLKLRSLQYL